MKKGKKSMCPVTGTATCRFLASGLSAVMIASAFPALAEDSQIGGGGISLIHK